MSSEAERLADEMREEAIETARAHLMLWEAAEGVIVKAPAQRELFELGVAAGYAGTLEMLVRRGLLPTTNTPEGGTTNA